MPGSCSRSGGRGREGALLRGVFRGSAKNPKPHGRPRPDLTCGWYHRKRVTPNLGENLDVSLSEYRRKRDPEQTSEPFDPAPRRTGQPPIFVVQRHDARRLHYDFRLERDGALASWAVPKGVPLEPGERALAVHVEDHPLGYATFSGEIPKGQYGAGSVEIWDNGSYELLEEKANGQLTFVLSGKRLQGTWSLVPAHLDGNERNWLMIKVAERDGEETSCEETPSSTRTYSPMLASPHEGIPAGDDWVYEVKFDGFRTIAYVRHGECKLLSRNDKDLTERFAEVAKEVVKATKSPNAVLDGELCRLDATGRASFSELQQGSGAVVLYAFDLLELDGVPLIDLPLEERKSRLQAAARSGQPRGAPVRGLRRWRSAARRGP